MAAWWLRGTCVSLLLLLPACTYADREPGLFQTAAPEPPSTSAPEPRRAESRFPPQPTNPALPVAGESVWTTGEGAAVTVRFAVHAVRRLAGATVLDWSVTPISGPGLRRGDPLPSQVDLGLARSTGGEVNISLLDGAAKRAYRPLAHARREEYSRCLCTPVWLVQRRLRVGETRMLQVTFPELPATMTHVDVSLANQVPWSHVPVTPEGQVPVAKAATDLARPADVPRPAARARRVEVRTPGNERRRFAVRIDQVAALSHGTWLQWTVQLRDEAHLMSTALSPPVSRGVSNKVPVVNGAPASGPRVLPAPRRGVTDGGVRWLTTTAYGAQAYECLCSELGVWSSTLRRADGTVSMAGGYPVLPRGARRVSVSLPGVGVVAEVPVTRAPDAARRVLPPVAAPPDTWTYNPENPPTGWATLDWPTPLPDPSQVPDYRSSVGDIVALPSS